MTTEIQTLKQAVQDFWEYYEVDDEWRHFYGPPGRENIAVIYLHGYKNGRCGLRIESGADEIAFPDVEAAKLYGFAVLQVYRQYLGETL
jgi:hypothetical protein